MYFHQGAPVPRLSGYYRLWDWHQRRIPTRVSPAQHSPAWLLHAEGCHSLCLHLLWLLTTNNAQFRKLTLAILSVRLALWCTEPPTLKTKVTKRKMQSADGETMVVIQQTAVTANTDLCAAGSLSRLAVGADSWHREESPGETSHSLDLLRETTGTSHTCYCLRTHSNKNTGTVWC